MSKAKASLGVIAQQADDGDGLASRMLHDMTEEDRLPDIPTLKRGDWLFIFTCAHYHCGQLLGDDHEYYYLAPGALRVWESGNTVTMHSEGAVDYGEVVPVISMIRRATITDIHLWGHERIPHVRKTT